VKRVGLLVGREKVFPDALIESINEKGEGAIRAEMILLGGTSLADEVPYRVIVDRISHEVPYYRGYLGKAVAEGTIVINNPFWFSADNKFIECVIAQRLGVAVPRTTLVPNRLYEADIVDESLRNLRQPQLWDDLLSHIGLPAVLKPAAGGGSKSVSVVRSRQELEAAWEASGTLQMILQEFIEYENYVRCFVIGRRDVRVSRFDISLPRHERYHEDTKLSPQLHDRVVSDCLTLTRALGYDIDTLEFAIRDGVPYAIDFFNPAPDCEPQSVTQPNFDWVVEHVSDLVIRYARDWAQEPPDPSARGLVASIPRIAAAEPHA
jgi:ATP-grasp domain